MYKHSRHTVAIPPGATIKEMLEDRHISQKEFANSANLTEKTTSLLLNGKAPLTPETALKLEMVLGAPARFWLGMEALYREDLIKVAHEKQEEADLEALAKLNYSALASVGWVEKVKTKAQKIFELKKFFEVSELNIIFSKKFCLHVAFRKLRDTEKSDMLAVAWCQKAKIEARHQELGKLDLIKKMPAKLRELRKLIARDNPDIAGAREILNDCGVALVILPQLNGSGIQGASFAVGDIVVMALTDRRKTADVFAFSFFHELGHVLHGHFHRCGELTAKDEKQADEFAKEQLIPSEDFKAFIKDGELSELKICDFAGREGISAGVVVGRLQKEKKIPYTRFNELKSPFEFLPS